ncbi:DUF4265 domain-containing protein [Pseudoxanthomonas composti]|uniref:DUF4265 domain-containing protein n=1 Tax=Pseudoxanthomonas composti TaxID=2137479 RepID=A0A4Q1JV15_9GAMM|nr:DUF4265 domain-containing protein [Pseudoxanthomonas composti]RXR05971.1 DUF4265 domain-containing protein [Pseudoxanthomonas composti]
MSSEPTAKVLFRLPSEEGRSIVETLWAVPLGNDLYQLDNSPFYAYGVSWQDVVTAPFDLEEQMPTFQSVAKRSGNRTVRVVFDLPLAPGNASEETLHGLAEIGCSFERANSGYVSVNIPPGVELEHVRSYLISRAAYWEHADPTFDSLFPNEA